VNDIIVLRWYDTTSIPSIQIAFSVIAAVGMVGCILGFNVVPLLLDIFHVHTDMTGTLQLAILTLSSVPAFAIMLNIYYALLDWYAAPVFELDDKESTEEESLFTGIKKLPLSYWLLFQITATSSAMVHVIMLYSVDYLTEKWFYSNLEGGQLSSAVYVTGIFSSLITGWVIHKFGQILTLMIIGIFSFSIGCIGLAIIPMPPIISLILIGIGLGSLEVCLWTAVAIVVEEDSIGPAFAFLSAIGAIMLMIIPFGAGYLHDVYNSYDPVAYFCAAMCLTGLISIFVLFIIVPKLQDPSDKFKKYYIVKIVTKRKKQPPMMRRHSIIFNDVKYIVNYLNETDQEDLLDHEQLFNEKNPVFFDLMLDETEVTYPSRNVLSQSLPKNFFSDTRVTELSLTQVQEDDAEYDSAIVVYDPNAVTEDEVDFASLWSQKN